MFCILVTVNSKFRFKKKKKLSKKFLARKHECFKQVAATLFLKKKCDYHCTEIITEKYK